MALAAPLLAKDASNLTPTSVDVVALLAPPPAASSAEQSADLAAVRSVHSQCSSNDAVVARSEKNLSIFNFSSAIGDFLQPARFPKAERFFQRLQNDTENAIDAGKEHFHRPRPYTVDPTLANGKLESSFSYPSGHSTQATVLAILLCELFPEKREQIQACGRDLGWHRVQIARHYPTDIYAGRVLGQAVVGALKSNPAFLRDFEDVKKELIATH